MGIVCIIEGENSGDKNNITGSDTEITQISQISE